MHPKFLKSDSLSKQVIGAAIEVHRTMGPGLVESIYEKCLSHELNLRGLPSKRQLIVPIEYKGYTFEEPLRLDILVDDCLLLELKSVETVHPIHKAQLLSYMKLIDVPIGLVLNFHEIQMRDGIHRMILPGANQ
jgi:GxxExxY protein